MIRLRKADLNDARQLYDWRNDAETRRASFNTLPIRYEDHLRWLKQKLSDQHVRFLIAMDEENLNLGYARLDLSADQAEISLSLDKHQRGKGIGVAFIQAVTNYAVDDLKGRRVVARIKKSNVISASAFRRAGFRNAAAGERAAGDSIAMVYEPGDSRVGSSTNKR